MQEIIHYPQFRHYKSGTSWFRIDSAEHYEEIRKMGNQWMTDQYTAKILPDRNWIYDLTFAYSDFAVAITQQEYEAVRRQAK
jgi:hypothetical protein